MQTHSFIALPQNYSWIFAPSLLIKEECLENWHCTYYKYLNITFKFFPCKNQFLQPLGYKVYSHMLNAFPFLANVILGKNSINFISFFFCYAGFNTLNSIRAIHNFSATYKLQPNNHTLFTVSTITLLFWGYNKYQTIKMP